ncbi:disrupted in schizophrenia 1 protein [Boleophthalmus pectinirostris]|uniref:disrupted in schizophrenia 1 protein n=1 Tax=Boleophthalmus pectinirostris TaxID=150288 RepID=UPI00242F0C74|nr:disrupted in schizophrenia 1 protein [Boleophthalmus pectinirostris]
MGCNSTEYNGRSLLFDVSLPVTWSRDDITEVKWVELGAAVEVVALFGSCPALFCTEALKLQQVGRPKHRQGFVVGGTGRASGSTGSTCRKRHKRPGYMRGERQPNDEEEEEEEEEGCGVLRNGKSGRHTSNANDATNTKNLVNQANQLSSTVLHKNILSSTVSTHSTMNCNGTLNNMKSPVLKTEKTIPKSPPFESSFNSSFSFIQQSLNCSQDFNTAPEPLNDTSSNLASLSIDQNQVQSLPLEKEDHKFWRDGLWSTRTDGDTGSDLPDIDTRSVDTEITSSLSVDSDTASASSVTSGYESATPASTEQGWESLVKKYDGVLQECLQNNRTHTKIESMMLKLQRLQQKAIQEDDYDAAEITFLKIDEINSIIAERFGKKLEELCRERGALRLGLPSRQPAVSQFLQRLSLVVNSALQRTDGAAQHRESTESKGAERREMSQDPAHRRDRLIQEKCLVEMEMAELQQRLSALEQRRRSLEEQIQDQDLETESEGLEASVLKTYSPPQLQDLHQTLQDLLSSQDRSLISVSPPPSVLRLQEQEQALNLSIKEATAKVVMSQRLGSSLRRRVSETETQLLALHEAKLAAISGNDFGSAKELKAEMRAVNQERERLEGLTRRLQTLSSSSSEDLRRLKEQRGQLRQERESGQAQHEMRLKDNASKYMELLEDRLQSYGCPGLERIWEADLEACHLFLRGLQLRTPSISGSDPLPSDLSTPTPPSTKEDEEEEEDCAMLTALGGRWCPEANLQNSEFTKKLEEFLFCVEDNAPEDGCSEAGGADLTEQCELISDRLMTLEEELQMAIHNRDRALTQSLEKEVQNVKATLQSMLTQLQKDEEEEDDEINKLEDDDLMENGLEEEEDQYFSDSWDI